MYDINTSSSLWPNSPLHTIPDVVIDSRGFTVNRRIVKRAKEQTASTSGEWRKDEPLSSPILTKVDASQQNFQYPHTGECTPMASPNLVMRLCYRLSELAALVGLSYDFLWLQIKSGDLKGYKIGKGKAIVVLADDVNEWLKKQPIESDDEKPDDPDLTSE
jgi:hypothetical protein